MKPAAPRPRAIHLEHPLGEQRVADGVDAALASRPLHLKKLGAAAEAERAEDWNDVAQAWADFAIAEELIGSGDPSAPLAALSNVERKLFAGLRHEIHNEPEQDEVLGFVVSWLDAQLA